MDQNALTYTTIILIYFVTKYVNFVQIARYVNDDQNLKIWKLWSEH